MRAWMLAVAILLSQCGCVLNKICVRTEVYQVPVIVELEVKDY